MFYLVSWDGAEYGSGYPSFSVCETENRGEDREGRAGSCQRWFVERSEAEQHCSAKNEMARGLLTELLNG